MSGDGSTGGRDNADGRLRAAGGRTRAQWTLLGIVVALAVAGVAHRLIVYGQLGQTAALFIGLPALLAAMVALSRPARSATGLILKVITIALLLSGTLVGEGMICVLMSAPLFYLVGWAFGAAIDGLRARRARREGGAGATVYAALALPFLAMSLEGVQPALSFPRAEVATASRVVAAAPAEVEAALAAPLRLDEPLPLYLRAGFPRPVASTGAGIQVGDRRTVAFQGRAGRPPRDLEIEVAARGPDSARFRIVQDKTKIAQWLTWREAEVNWVPLDTAHTRVTWTLRYERRLDPAWYFAPWEHYATGLAADYLIRATATPR